MAEPYTSSSACIADKLANLSMNDNALSITTANSAAVEHNILEAMKGLKLVSSNSAGKRIQLARVNQPPRLAQDNSKLTRRPAVRPTLRRARSMTCLDTLGNLEGSFPATRRQGLTNRAQRSHIIHSSRITKSKPPTSQKLITFMEELLHETRYLDFISGSDTANKKRVLIKNLLTGSTTFDRNTDVMYFQNSMAFVEMPHLEYSEANVRYIAINIENCVAGYDTVTEISGTLLRMRAFTCRAAPSRVQCFKSLEKLFLIRGESEQDEAVDDWTGAWKGMLEAKLEKYHQTSKKMARMLRRLGKEAMDENEWSVPEIVLVSSEREMMKFVGGSKNSAEERLEWGFNDVGDFKLMERSGISAALLESEADFAQAMEWE